MGEKQGQLTGIRTEEQNNLGTYSCKFLKSLTKVTVDDGSDAVNDKASDNKGQPEHQLSGCGYKQESTFYQSERASIQASRIHRDSTL